MSGYINYFENRGRNMSFKIEDNVLVQYNGISNRILKNAKHFNETL